MREQKRILLIDFTNYQDYPIGGYLTFARNMIMSFGNKLSLIGITTEKNETVGRWIKKEIDGLKYDFFALRRYDKSRTKHIIPDRFMSYILLRFHKRRILECDIQNVFIQRQEMLPGVRSFGYSNICYRFPGTENPLQISKYWFGKFLADAFDRMFFSSISKVNLILASGDKKAIDEMIVRSMGKISYHSVVKFPTKINSAVFKPGDKKKARENLDLPLNKLIVVTTGRLTKLKGWEFMVHCFISFLINNQNSLFYIIGDGEEKLKIRNYIETQKLEEKVILAGKKSQSEIADFLRAADLFIMGSYVEGWPTSLVEAVACGVPACITSFSGASEIVLNGENGFISERRDVSEFVKLMQKALEIKILSVDISQYTINTLKEDLMRIWQLV